MDFCIMEKTFEYLKKSLQKAISLAGNMRKLAEERGMDYSTINRFNSGENAIENIPLKTIVKLFPELRIYCFQSDMPKDLQPPTVCDSDIVEEMSEVVSRLSPKDKVKLLSMVARFEVTRKE